MTILLILIGAITFVSSGIGFLLINSILLGLLEVMAMLFSGLIGFIILGLVISWILTSFNKHS
jgi:hypothetical protein